MRLSRTASLKPICAAIALTLSGLAQASSSGLVISQVYGGGGSTSSAPTPLFKQDWVELFNAGSSSVSLSGITLQYGSAAGNYGTSASQIVALPNIALTPGQYYLVQMPLSPANATGADLGITADLQGTIQLSGSNGKVALVTGLTGLGCGTATCDATALSRVIDRLSYGSGNNAEVTATAALTTSTVAQRLASGCTDTNNNAADFAVTSTATPRNLQSALSACQSGGTPGGTTPVAATIGQIQGTGHTSPMVGQTVTTTGVVTKINNNGFFMQSLVPDAMATTSDGIFVFTSTPNATQVGQHVQLTGLVDEFNVGAASNAQTLAHTVTELKNVTNLSVLSSGNTVNPTVITFPEATEDDLEKVEGMLITINTELTADQNYFLGRYGQITLSAGGRLVKPTNAHPAGSADAINMANDNARRRILLDDGSSLQNPNPTPYVSTDNTQRAGDTIASITGVIDYGLATSSNLGLADYKIHPTQAVVFTRTNARTAAPATVGGNIKVASFNVLNFFTTFTNGNTATGATGQGCTLGGATSASNCRGADSITEFNRQRNKIVKAIAAINADVIGLMEIQNNGNTAVQNLVDALNTEMGQGSYATVSLPTAIAGTAAGTGTDAIRVAMIYKPANVSLVSGAMSDTAAINNRPPLAQTFGAANGEQFTVIVNHFKSKSCDAQSAAVDLDQGDGQGCFNDRRQQQATQLRSFINSVQTLRGDNDVLVIGDLNAYGKESPILNLTGNSLVDLIETFNGISDYSYVFDGELGYLDHALASTSMAPQVTGTAHWHINADEPFVIDYNVEFKQPVCASCGPDYYTASPYRSSDHDPVVIGLKLIKQITGTARGDVLTGTPGDDRIVGGEGADLITTGSGRDVIVYNSLRDALDTVTDFTAGQDRIDLSAIAATLHAAYPLVDLIASGFIQLVDTSSGLQIRIDTDGNTGAAAARPLLTLRGVSAAQIVVNRDLIL
ncbi:MAG: ExeM/NucH family extracellular endonuclease [Aquabacterium sp.]|nr:ExeM/NucH family extracellular endonuclease [Aquabacterium sp.]